MSQFLTALVLCTIFLHFSIGTPVDTGVPDLNGTSLVPLLEVNDVQYLLSKEPADQESAKQICQLHGGHLLTIDSLGENRVISKLVKKTGIDSVWTCGIKYSNATVENLYLWPCTSRPFLYTNVYEEASKSRPLLRAARDKRSICNSGDGKCCPCPTTPPPFVTPPCKLPTCNVTLPQPPCEQTSPRQCVISGRPECVAKDRNCEVDCREECRIIEQPVCTVKPSSKPRCILEELGKCEAKPAVCRVVSPGECRSVQEKCVQDDSDACKSTKKPCKDACTERPCVSTQPPCVTVQPPCTTTEGPPDCSCKKTCRKLSRQWHCASGSKCEAEKTECEASCQSACNATITCPGVTTVCPPPVTTCGRPFVDCSPILCQSSVIICGAPRIHCPPPRTVCDPPVIECEPSEVICPEAEVKCLPPDIKCTKPKIECPDAVVNCDPVVSTCDPAPFHCNQPDWSCKHPSISCGEPIPCNNTTPTPPPPPDCSCDPNVLSSSFGRQIMSSETELVETTECVVIRKELDYKWTTHSCDIKYQFICEKPKLSSPSSALHWYPQLQV